MYLRIIQNENIEKAIEYIQSLNFEKLTNTPKTEIYEEKGYLHIMVKNTVDKFILKSNPYLITTKNDNEYYGFGILSIKDTVQKYDGLMDFYEKDLLFVCHILLKIKT